MLSLNETDGVFLFDMDGTLTPARKKIQSDMVGFLTLLSKEAHIGVVSGSPASYIFEQLEPFISTSTASCLQKVVIMPCNGTQVYVYDTQKCRYNQTYGVTFKDHLSSLGDSSLLYREIVKNLISLQSHAVEKYSGLPLSGNFVSFRTSLLNWCMIGRDANHDQREAFVGLDKKYKIREYLSELLRIRLDASGLHSIETALGGSTSIDIYPDGWDKTHALRHVEPAWTFFFGDKCQPGGNDHTLYTHLEKMGRSWEVKSPKETILICSQILEKIKEDRDG